MAKLVKKKQQQESAGKEIVRNLLEYTTALVAVILCVFVPLYMKDGYYQIGTAKYNAYAHIIVFGMPLLLILALIYAIFAVKDRKRGVQQQSKAPLSGTDIACIVYLLSVLVSYFASGELKNAFWGYDGWFMGLFSQVSFVLIYFLYSRFGKEYKLILWALCLTAAYAFAIGILHRLYIDPLGVYEGLDLIYIQQFLSTLGQASWYSSFMCTVLPIGVYVFWKEERPFMRVVSGIFTFAGFATLVTQNTDSAYFAMAAMFLVLLLASAGNGKHMQRLFFLAAMFFLAAKTMQLLLMLHPNETLALDTISTLVVFDARIWILAVLCLIFSVLFGFLQKKGRYPAYCMRWVSYIVTGAVVVLIAVWAVILVMSTKGALPAPVLVLAEKIPYLQWDGSWGNGRGFTWSVTFQMIREMNPLRLLIGAGPDCYAYYGYEGYEELIRSRWGSNILTNAHNEWLNMVINGGLIGAVSYISIFITAFVRFWKKREEKPLVFAAVLCIASYMAHNVFCYQQVLCTPFLFLILALAEYRMRTETEKI